MRAIIPAGLRPAYSAMPVQKPEPLTRAEVRDTIYFLSDGPRGYGSQLAPWQGGAR